VLGQGKALWTGHINFDVEGRFDKEVGEPGEEFGRLMFQTFLNDCARPWDGGAYEIHDGTEERLEAALIRGMVTGVSEFAGVPFRVVVADADGNINIPVGDRTVTRLAELRFGEKRVAYDPSDPEANKLAVSRGYTVVHGGHLSKPEWDAVKRTNAILPAGQVTPSPKPFSPDGKPLTMLPEEQWTPDIKAVVAYIRRLAPMLVGAAVAVQISIEPGWPFRAVYGSGDLILNLKRLGNKWFRAESLREVNRLLIHELGHHFSGDHLSAEYHDALCRLGARLAELALVEPSLFRITDVIGEQAIGQGGRCEAVPRSTDHRRSKTVE
jgi:hypothetical protein